MVRPCGLGDRPPDVAKLPNTTANCRHSGHEPTRRPCRITRRSVGLHRDIFGRRHLCTAGRDLQHHRPHQGDQRSEYFGRGVLSARRCPTFWGFVASPSLWLLTSASLVALGLGIGHAPNASTRSTVSPPPAVFARQMPAPAALTQSQPQHPGGRFVGSTCYMGECFDQYIMKETRRSDGTQEVIVNARNYNASNPQVTLGLPTAATFWVSCGPSGGYVENEQHIRLPQPNPKPSHATEPGDKLWKVACFH